MKVMKEVMKRYTHGAEFLYVQDKENQEV